MAAASAALPATEPGAGPAVDAATRQAAAALSVANSGVRIEQGASARARQCADAIEASAQWLRSSPLVGEAEYREILRASSIYEERAGGAAGPGEPPDAAADRTLAGADGGDPGTTGPADMRDAPRQALRIALGCLRALTQEAS